MSLLCYANVIINDIEEDRERVPVRIEVKEADGDFTLELFAPLKFLPNSRAGRARVRFYFTATGNVWIVEQHISDFIPVGGVIQFNPPLPKNRVSSCL